MTTKNKYQKFSKISVAKFRLILRLFALDPTASDAARLNINGIESFWRYAKKRLIKFNGVAKHTFYLHLKETEFRFNHRHNNLYKVLLKMLRNHPLN